MSAEDRLTQAIEDAGALSDIISFIDGIGTDDAAAHYLRRKLRENANELSDAFSAFCDEVNKETKIDRTNDRLDGLMQPKTERQAA